MLQKLFPSLLSISTIMSESIIFDGNIIVTEEIIAFIYLTKSPTSHQLECLKSLVLAHSRPTHSGVVAVILFLRKS